jgi:hypothetical protein
LYLFGEWPKGEIDHVNRDSLDNRIANLRDVSQSENARNRPQQANSTSGVKGVYWHKASQRWQAQIAVNGKQIHLGLFDTLDEAARARFIAEARLTERHPPAIRVWAALFTF